MTAHSTPLVSRWNIKSIVKDPVVVMKTGQVNLPTQNRKSCHFMSFFSNVYWLKPRWLSLPLATIFIAGHTYGSLPNGLGKEETQRLCVGCHEIGKSVSLRQDKDGWNTTIAKMIGFGMKATEDELQTVLNYLTKWFPAEKLPPLNVNKARAIQFESRLSLKRSEAARIIRYRTENGDFKSIEDLKKVPGVNAAKIEAKKDTLVF